MLLVQLLVLMALLLVAVVPVLLLLVVLLLALALLVLALALLLLPVDENLIRNPTVQKSLQYWMLRSTWPAPTSADQR